MLGRGLMTMGVLLAITGCVVSADAKRVMERYAQSRVGVEPIRAFDNHESAWCGAKSAMDRNTSQAPLALARAHHCGR